MRRLQVQKNELGNLLETHEASCENGVDTNTENSKLKVSPPGGSQLTHSHSPRQDIRKSPQIMMTQ